MNEGSTMDSTEEWSVDLPNWRSQPDPQIAATLWVHTDYDGQPDLALAIVEEGDNRMSVLSPVIITDSEIDGCERATFRDRDEALEFALRLLENTP